MSDVAATPVPWSYRDTALATLTMVAVAVAFLLLYFFRSVLFYLFAGIVLATALKPLIAAVERLRTSHQTATFLVHAALVGALVGGAALGLPMIAEEATSLAAALPNLYDSARERLIDAPSTVLARLGSALPSDLAVANEDLNTHLDLSTVATAFTWGAPVLHGMFMLAAVLLLSFFWSVQEERTLRSLLLWLPPARRDEARSFFDAAQAKLGAYVRGQSILCAVVGVLSLVAFLIIGLPSAIALAGLAGLLESVPVFGPTLGAVPAILVAANVDPMLIVWVVGAAIVIQQVENYVLVPRVMSHSVGVNPLVTLLAIAAFTGLLGLPGAILAIPMAAVVQLVLERWVLDPGTATTDAPIGRGAVGRLQYRVRELLQDARQFVRHKDECVAEGSDRIEEAIETIAEELAEQLSAVEPVAPSAESVEAPASTSLPPQAPAFHHGLVDMMRLALHTATVLATFAGLLLLWQLRYPVLLFALSLAVAAVLRPLIERLIGRGWPKTLAVMVMYGQLIAAIVLLLGFALQPLLAETQQFGDTMMLAYNHAVHTWPDRGGWREVFARQLPPPGDLYETIVGNRGPGWLQAGLGMTFSLFSNLVDLVVVMVMSIYWSLDRDHFERLWLSILPARKRIETRDLWRSLEFEAGDYLRSEIVQSTGAGILLWCGLTVLGYPLPVLVALLGAIAWLVPWAGMLIAAATVALLGLPRLVLVGGTSTSGWFFGSIAFTVLVLLVLEVFIEPRVFGRRRYNSLLMAVVMVGLADVLGVIGLVLGPPLAAALQIVGTRLLRKRVLGDTPRVEVDLNEKVATLADSLAEIDRPAPELSNMVDRLQDLVNEVQQ